MTDDPAIARLYRSSDWRKVRRAVLERDAYVCKVQGPKCTIVAESVDHIVSPRIDLSRFLDPSNLRAACKRCNYGRRGQSQPAGQIGQRNPSREW